MGRCDKRGPDKFDSAEIVDKIVSTITILLIESFGIIMALRHWSSMVMVNWVRWCDGGRKSKG